ncbi:asparaginase domain-containing protein [Legionella fairfieldensis]|uniref:asparaginase domain-containing protein n=1 Tax=Legionella fairfieldensis TaxID=45064 RepID=UPI00048DE76A|nr:asparaginase domain-containing protein [Legionella fairfieldensis]
MKKIAVLDLGGTISNYTPKSTAEFYSQKGASLYSFINELPLPGKIEVNYESFSNIISHELSPDDLLNLGRKIQNIIDDPNVFGLVVSMGTNALEDVAYFIGLVVKTKKCIVFTGAHFPQNSLAFDGKKNLFNAIVVAQSDYSQDLGVVVTLNDTVTSARWATKNKPGISNDFSNDGIGGIGYVVGDIFHQKMQPLHKCAYSSEFSIHAMQSFPKIGMIYAHFCIAIDHINYIINNNIINGIVSAGYGKGYQTKEISTLLNKAVLNGIPVVRCARSGLSITNVDPSYDNKYGFVVASEFSPHKASILLSVCLAHRLSKQEIQRVFEEY